MNTSIEEAGVRDEAEPLVCLPPSCLPSLSLQRKRRPGFDCASFLCCILGVKCWPECPTAWVTSVSSTHAEPGNQVSSVTLCMSLLKYRTVISLSVPGRTQLEVVANASHDSCRCSEPSGACPRAYEQCAPEARLELPAICMRDSPFTGVALHQGGQGYLSCYWFDKTWYCHIPKFFLPELWNITYKGLGYMFLIASVKNHFPCTYQTGFFFSKLLASFTWLLVFYEFFFSGH